MFVHRATREEVRRSPEGRLLAEDLTELNSTDVVEVCDVCEEPGTEDDPLWWLATNGVAPTPTSPVYHERCVDAGVEDGVLPPRESR